MSIALVGSFVLSACGGGSAPPSDAGTQSATGARGAALAAQVDASGAWRLFVPDLAHAAINAAPSLAPVAGTELPGSEIQASGVSGNNVQLDGARDELYSLSGRFVTVYAGASTLRAGALPERSFALPAGLGTPRTLYLDTGNDVLYVGGDMAAGGGEIVAYPFAHTVRGTPATPARAMLIDEGVAFFTIDPVRQRLYVVNASAGVHVYANVDSASGVLAPATTIPVLGSGLAIDVARDRLYVADMFAGLILVDQASAAAPVVTATLSIDDARYVAIDAARDRAYVSALGGLYVIDQASHATAATALGAPALAHRSNAAFGTVGVR